MEDGVDVGPSLIANGGFETGDLTDWVAIPQGGTIAVTDVDKNGGVYSVQIVADVDGNGGAASFPVLESEPFAQNVVNPSEQVHVSFDIKGSIAGAGGVPKAALFSNKATGQGAVRHDITLPALTSSWQNVTVDITTDATLDITNGLTLQFQADCGGVGGCIVDMRIDNISVTADSGPGGGGGSDVTLLDFENSLSGVTSEHFETGGMIISNPASGGINTSANVYDINYTSGNQWWGGVGFLFDPNLVDDQATEYKVKLYSTVAPTNVLFQVEVGGTNAPAGQVQTITTANQWEEVTFTLTGVPAGSNRILIRPDVGDQSTTKPNSGNLYADDIVCVSCGGGADTTPPVITLVGDATVNLTQGDSYTDAGATATDDVDGDITGNIVVAGDVVDVNTIGSYVITYNVSDAAANAAIEVTRTVNVSAGGSDVTLLDFENSLSGVTSEHFETGGMIISNPASGGINTSANVYDINYTSGNQWWGGVGFLFDPNLVDDQATEYKVKLYSTVAPTNVLFQVEVGGTNAPAGQVQTITTANQWEEVTFTLTGVPAGSNRILIRPDVGDQSTTKPNSGNLYADDIVCVSCGGGADTTPPVITLVGDATVNLTQGDSYTDAGATATDDVDGDITGNIVVAGDVVDVNTIGSYVITYNVSDAAANAAIEVTRTVNVSAGGSDVTLLDFENSLSGVTSEHFETGGMIISNPASGGINTSANVYDINYTSGNQWWGGVGFLFDPNLVDDQATEYKVKLYSTVAPTNVLFQVEVGGTNAPAGQVQTITTANQWEEVTFTLTGVPAGSNRILIRPDVGDQSTTKPNSGNLYVDDIVCVSCGGNGGGGSVPNGSELVVNGGFESGPNPPDWEFFDQGGSITITDTEPRDGTYSALIVADVAGNGGAASFPVMQQSSFGANNVSPGDQVRVTFDIKAVSGTAAPVYKAALFSNKATGQGAVRHDITLPAFTGEWQTVTMDITTDGTLDPANGLGIQFQPDCGANPTCSAQVYIDNVSVFVLGDIDPERPVITLIGDNPFELTTGTPFVDPGATATDNVDGDISGSVVASGDVVNENIEGTYEIRYNVTDAAGNDAIEVTRIVNVSAGGGGGVDVGPSLIANGGFETGDLTDWVAIPQGGTIAVTDVDKNGGVYSVQIVADVDGNGGAASFPVLESEPFAQNVVNPSEQVHVSFDIKGSIAGAGGVPKAALFSNKATGQGAVRHDITLPALTSSWQNVTVDITTDATLDITNGLTLQFQADCGGVGGCIVDMRIDNISVTADSGPGGGGGSDVTLLDFENSLSGVTSEHFETGGMIISNPASGGINTSANVYDINYTSGNQWWGGVGFLFDPNLVDDQATEYKVKLYSTVAPTNVLFQVEVGGTNAPAGQVQTITTANQWEEVTFTLTGVPAGSNRILIRPDVGDQSTTKPNSGNLYADDIVCVSCGGGADTTPPVITLVGDATVNLTQGDSYTDAGATATDDVDGDITGNIVVAGDVVDVNTIGSYVITYNVSDAAANAAIEVTRTVNVSAGGSDVTLLDFENSLSGVTSEHFETGGMIISNPASGGINTSANVYDINYTSGNQWWGGVGFLFDPNLVDDQATEYKVKLYSTVAPTNVLFQVEVGGTNAPAGQVQTITTANQWEEVTFTLTGVPAGSNRILIRPDVGDQSTTKPNSGNLYADDIVCVSCGGGADTTPPVITLVGDATVNLTQGDSYTDAGATATDDVDGDITGNIVVAGDVVDVNTIGSYVITYNVSDAAANAAIEVTRTVNVSAGGSDVTLLDFENSLSGVTSEHFETGGMIISNPASGGINTSANVYDINYTSGNQWWGGVGFLFDPNLVDDQATEYKVKLYSTVAPTNVLFQVEVGGTNAPAGQVQTITTANQWEEVTFTLTGVPAGSNRILIRPDVGDQSTTKPNSGNLYVDDIVCVSCGGNGGGGSVPNGSELVVNGGFESGPNPPDWEFFDQGGSITITDTEPRDGTYSALIVADVAGNGGAASFPVMQQSSFGANNVSPGDQVRVTFDIKAVSGTAAPVYKAALFSNKATGQGAVRHDITLPAFTGEWQTVTMDITTDGTLDPANGLGIQFQPDCGANPTCSAQVYIDNVSVFVLGDIDPERPVITLIGDNPFELTTGTPFVDPGATATDNVDGDISGSVVASGDVVNENIEGTYEIRYNVTDAAGNDAIEVTRIVNVSAGGGGGVDVGPSLIANGGFETGDLTDWVAIPQGGTIAVTDVDKMVEFTLFKLLRM